MAAMRVALKTLQRRALGRPPSRPCGTWHVSNRTVHVTTPHPPRCSHLPFLLCLINDKETMWPATQLGRPEASSLAEEFLLMLLAH